MNRWITARLDIWKLSLSRLLPLFLFLVIHTSSFSQSPYLMSLENPALTNDNTFEFDVFINSAGNDFTLTSYQCAFTFDVGNTNNGTLNFSYISGTSELENTPQYSVGINQNDGVNKLTFASSVGTDIINTSPQKIGRFRLENNEQFSSQSFEISWSFDGFVNTILTGEGITEITNPSGHSNLVFINNASLKLLNASAVDLTTVRLNFSKQAEQTSANDTSNYSINNNIEVTDAALSSDGFSVTLTTTEHIAGQTYTVVVNSVKDLSGTLIDTTANSQQYTQAGSDLFINVTAFLDGPYTDGAMDASLNELEFIPLEHPFNTSPWGYNGPESVSALPQNVVDWILIELRSGISSNTIVMRRAAFISTDGSLVDLDGVSKVKVTGVGEGNYYIVLRHRNHLAVMSSSKINVSGNPQNYDFTTASDKAYGTEAQVRLIDGKYGMYAADGNKSGSVNNADANSIWKRENGNIGYYSGDFDMNGGVNIVDKNSKWKMNTGKSSQVP